jgi:hypothetical protein
LLNNANKIVRHKDNIINQKNAKIQGLENIVNGIKGPGQIEVFAA